MLLVQHLCVKPQRHLLSEVLRSVSQSVITQVNISVSPAPIQPLTMFLLVAAATSLIIALTLSTTETKLSQSRGFLTYSQLTEESLSRLHYKVDAFSPDLTSFHQISVYLCIGLCNLLAVTLCAGPPGVQLHRQLLDLQRNTHLPPLQQLTEKHKHRRFHFSLIMTII